MSVYVHFSLILMLTCNPIDSVYLDHNWNILDVYLEKHYCLSPPCTSSSENFGSHCSS